MKRFFMLTGYLVALMISLAVVLVTENTMVRYLFILGMIVATLLAFVGLLAPEAPGEITYE